MLKKYLKNLFIAISQIINTILGGDPDETFSSRLGKWHKGSWLAKLVDWLFSWQKRVGSVSHVENAAYWDSDEGKDAIIK